MPEIGTTYAGQRRGPSRIPARGLEDEAERQEGLNAHITESATLEDEKDLTAKFREAEAIAIGGADHPMEEGRNAIDATLLRIKERAAANVAEAKLTPAELQAKATATALADVLTERGLVTEPPSAIAADEYDEPEPDQSDAGDTLYGWLDPTENRYYATDGNGLYLTDANGRYITYPADSVVEEDELEEGEEVVGWLEEEYDDAA